MRRPPTSARGRDPRARRVAREAPQRGQRLATLRYWARVETTTSLCLQVRLFIYLFIFVVGGACARDRPRIRNDSLVLYAPGAKTVHLTADESHRPGAMPVNGGSGNRNEPSNQIPFPPSFFFWTPPQSFTSIFYIFFITLPFPFMCMCVHLYVGVCAFMCMCVCIYM